MYRKVIVCSAVVVTIVFAMAGGASALLLNQLTSDGGGTILFNYPEAAIADTGVEAVALSGGESESVAALYFAYAGYYNSDYLSFGIYDFSYDSSGGIHVEDTLLLGDTASGFEIGKSTTVTFENGLATSAIGAVTLDTANIGDVFGFYLHNSRTGYTFYTHNALNVDNEFDHALMFDTRSITSGSEDLMDSDMIIAFEDLYGGGDRDYNDFVFGVSNVAPVPEPPTMVLLGMGLISLAGYVRKKVSGR